MAGIGSLGVAAGCSLDLGPVLTPAKDAGTDAKSDAMVFVLPPGCLNSDVVQATCDPRSNAGCGDYRGCDRGGYTQPRLVCLPTDGVQLGGKCDAVDGPYCAGKYSCNGTPGVCTKFCCTNAECPGGTCLTFDPFLGSLGICSNAGDAGPGDASSPDAGD